MSMGGWWRATWGGKSHGKLQTAVWLGFPIRKGELNRLPFVEQRVQFVATRYRVPDVCVVRAPEPDTEVFDEPPPLCQEVRDGILRVAEVQVPLAELLF